jgi:ATP-binding cassette subfamily B protein
VASPLVAGTGLDRRPHRAAKLLRRVAVLFGMSWRANPRLMTGCVLASVATSVLGLAYPLGFRAIVDGAVNRHAGVVVTGAVIVAVSFPLSWVLRLVSATQGSKLTDQTNLRLGLLIGRLVNAAPFLEHFENPAHVREIDVLRERRRTLAGSSAQMLAMIRSGLQFIGAAVLLALVWPPLVVVPLLAIAPALADRRAGQIEKRNDTELADPRRLVNELFGLAATAGPARELRTFGATEALLSEHTRLGDEVRRRAMRAARRAALWEAAGWLLYAAGFAGAMVLLVLRAAHGDTTAGAVVETISLMRRAQRQVSGATASAGSFATASTTADRLIWLEDYVAAAGAGGTEAAPARLETGIRLEHVSFRYPAQEAEALHDISLELRAGTTVALVGENGAGKSTLIKLLTGMYQPDSGQILADGQDLARLDPEQWRAATTGAFQDFVRFHMSLGDGVGAGDLPRRDEDGAVTGALAQAGAEPMVAGLPDGLDTLLGPWIGGRSLSGGQWQRLALARGLMRPAPLLIVLDEPTASLDAPSEAALFGRYQEATRRLGPAAGTVTILVSHRFSTVHMADQIVVLDGGRVTETGDHTSLIQRQGLYAELFALQAAGFSDP